MRTVVYILLVYIVRIIVRVAKMGMPLHEALREEVDALMRQLWWHDNVGYDSSMPVVESNEAPRRFSEVRWRVVKEPRINFTKDRRLSWDDETDILCMHVHPVGIGCIDLNLLVYSTHPQYSCWTTLKLGDEFSLQPATETERRITSPELFEHLSLKAIHRLEQVPVQDTPESPPDT